MAAPYVIGAEDDPGTLGSLPQGREAFLAALRARVGTRIGASAWTEVDQARIDRFAEATGDRQFVHVDPIRAAAETPFGGTVAHGYLTLAMLGGAASDVLPAHPCVQAVLNLGADKVRFLAPVRVNTQIRSLFTLDGVVALPEDKVVLRLGATVDMAQAEVGTSTALKAELTLMLVLAR